MALWAWCALLSRSVSSLFCFFKSSFAWADLLNSWFTNLFSLVSVWMSSVSSATSCALSWASCVCCSNYSLTETNSLLVNLISYSRSWSFLCKLSSFPLEMLIWCWTLLNSSTYFSSFCLVSTNSSVFASNSFCISSRLESSYAIDIFKSLIVWSFIIRLR